MQAPNPVNESPSSSAPQSRDAKIAIMRRNGYSEARLAGLDGTVPMPPVPDDLIEEPAQVAPEDSIAGFDGPGTFMGIDVSV